MRELKSGRNRVDISKKNKKSMKGNMCLKPDKLANEEHCLVIYSKLFICLCNDGVYLHGLRSAKREDNFKLLIRETVERKDYVLLRSTTPSMCLK
jgi:hypothetical protein